MQILSRSPRMEDFKMASSRVGSEGCIALAQSLQSGSCLTRLDLSDNPTDSEVRHACIPWFSSWPLLPHVAACIHLGPLPLKGSDCHPAGSNHYPVCQYPSQQPHAPLFCLSSGRAHHCCILRPNELAMSDWSSPAHYANKQSLERHAVTG